MTLLTSLRPRRSDDKSTLIPSAAALHTLQRTLPLQATPGWHGTLPATSSATAIRDDTTIKVRPGASVAPAPTVAAVPAAITPSPVTPAPTSFASYNYNYSNNSHGQTLFRATGTPVAGQTTFPSTGYRPGNTATPSYYPQQYQQQSGQNNYYASQAYNSATQPYSSGYAQQWYQQYNNGVTTNSGRGTPQPAGAQFSQYYPNATSATPSRPAAVANTVVGKPMQWAQPATPIGHLPAVRTGQSSFQTTR